MPNVLQFATIARLVRNGSISQMERVIANWPPSGSLVDLFDAFSPHFSIPESEKDLLGEEGLLRLRRARLASSARSACDTISARVLLIFDDIIWWQVELLIAERDIDQRKQMIDTIILLLLAAYSFTGALAQAIISSPSAIELVAVSVTEGCPTVDLMDRLSYLPPLLSLLSDLLSRPESRTLLLDSVADRGPSSVSHFTTKIVSLVTFFEGRYVSGPIPAKPDIPMMFALLWSVLDLLSHDSRYQDALRKQGYAKKSVRCLYAFCCETNPLDAASVGYLIKVLGWIRSYQPRRYRVPLVHDFVAAGGLQILIHAVQTYVEQDVAMDTLCSLLGFTLPRRLRRSIKEVADNMERRILARQGIPQFGLRSYFPFSPFTWSFEARLPSDEVPDATKLDNSMAFCNNLMHFDRNLEPDHAPKARRCSRCRTVSYCCESCQREDWAHVHRFECRSLSNDEKALAKDGVQLARATVHYFRFITRNFIPTPDTVKEQMTAHSCDLEQGKAVYIDRDIEHPGKKYEIVSVDQYREVAKGYTSWSSARFDAVVEFVRSRKGARLIAFDEPCLDERLHILCALVGESQLVVAMAQIE
ncbi:hypothetical protein BKA70DRAFT_1290017 [Coprinopsis sp. MPI-PUGE-AT-0042]|nr:hypothetical protein BKA70DRAFT_1290017 [Coprinopsis sp. MPI-PUGE-AT-0042]